MGKLSDTIKRKAKVDRVGQLEKHIANGKQLVGRLCQEIDGKNQVIEQQAAQLRGSQSIIGVLVAMSGEKEIEVNKSAIKEMIEKYNVSSVESEDKLSFIIKVEEAPRHENEQGAVEGIGNEGQDGTRESVGDASTSTETEQVQESENDIGRDNICEQEGSKEICGAESFGESGQD